MDEEIPIWLETLVMAGAGALAGGAAAAALGADVKSRAAGVAVTFAVMNLAWRAGHRTENQVRALSGLPPAPGKRG